MHNETGRNEPTPLITGRHKGPVRIGEWQVEPDLSRIARGGTTIALEPKAMAVLMYLAARPGRLADADELIEAVWQGRPMGENPVYKCIAQLRKAFGDDSRTPRYIATVPRKGYCLIAPVSPMADAPAAPPEIASAPAVPGPPRARRWALALAVAGTVLLLGSSLVWRTQPSTPMPGPGMLAVLPFDNFTGDPELDHVSDGLTEELIAELGGRYADQLGVIARTSVMRYRGAPHSIAEIARELKADYVVESSVRREGERLRIISQLIRSSDETHLWAGRYDYTSDNLLDLQADLAREVAREVHLRIAPTRDASTPHEPPAAARESYYRGRYLLERRDADSLRSARAHLEHAIEVDPNFALAYTGIAELEALSITYLDTPTEVAMTRARAALATALELDDDLPLAHALLGSILGEHDWNWDGAEAQLKRAIQLNPNFARARVLYAELLSYQGRFAEALEQASVARRLDPLSPVTGGILGTVQYRARRYGDAERQLRQMVETDPEHPLAYLPLGLTYSQQGLHGEAVTMLERARDLAPGNPEIAGQLAYVYARAGQRERALRLVEELTAVRSDQAAALFALALAYAGLDMRDEAISELKSAVAERLWYVCVLKTEPAFDALRADGRFRELLAAVNLAGS